MTITLTWQTILTAFAVLGAVVGIIAYFAGAVRRVDKWNKQPEELKKLEAKHEADIKAVQEELRIICNGMLAALKGLREQGCNGPVTKAINEIETHLNEAAHEK